MAITGADGCGLVLLHQGAVTGHVREHDGSEVAVQVTVHGARLES
jgi:hypothetical protein